MSKENDSNEASADHSFFAANQLIEGKALKLADAAGWSSERREKFSDVLAAIRIHGEDLAGISKVVAVQPSFRFLQGKITNQPCVAVTVLRKLDSSEIPVSQIIPPKLGKVLVDIVPATPQEQINYHKRRSISGFAENTAAAKISTLLPGEADFREPSAAGFSSLIRYEPPAAAPLRAIDEEMTIVCHASPDAGWRILSEFLRGTAERLTATMYEFNAGYIFDALVSTFSDSKQLNLILDGGKSAEVPNAAQGDVSKNSIRQELKQALNNRFNFVWAAVADDGKTTSSFFPSAYHIKVAVRDGSAFWLSSGNWKRSNQPPLDPFSPPAGFNGWKFLRSQGFNREWHVIVHHRELAELFEKYITNDINAARPLQKSSSSGLESTEVMPDLFVPKAFFDISAALQPPLFFKERTFTKKIRVEPLLTPDLDENEQHLFIQRILPLIENAREKIYFQNQSLSASWNLPEHTRLFRALSEKSRDQNLDVRIIVSEYAVLANLLAANFDMSRVRQQRECHNKGIIIDDETVVVGSQNWTGQGTTQNRDASLIIHDAEIAGYFAEIFLFDWSNLAKTHSALMLNMPIVALDQEPTPAGMARVAWSEFFPDSPASFVV